MVKKKEFDCVRMKHEIQEQILREFAGMSPDQQRRRTREMIESEPVLGKWWKRATVGIPDKEYAIDEESAE